MAWEDDPQGDQDGVYGLELVQEGKDWAEDEESAEAGSRRNPEATVEQRETIVGSTARQLPRILRVAGLVAVVVGFTIALWPSAGSKQAPAPLRIRVAGTTLAPSGRITTLTMILANDATSSASVDEADIRDADGHRIGDDRRWPAGDIPAGSTLSLDIAVPYTCDTHLQQHMPVTLHVSVASAPRTDPPRELTYPVDPRTWQEFEHFQSGVCSSAASKVEVGPVSITDLEPATHSIKVRTDVSVHEPLTLDDITATNEAVQVTADPRPPLTLPATGWQPITTTWRVPDCASMAGHWGDRQELVFAYEGPLGGTSLTVPLPDDVVAQFAATACPSLKKRSNVFASRTGR
ncbi:MAG: hypothetical protein HOV87_07945 [Catenulispora sp.]|nr:hypothetical protein [Catenulispora sp.]